MRMWNVHPKLMCRQHLLGEHLEMHMFQEHVRHNRSLIGYVKNGLVEVHNIRKRHDILAEELLRRGYNHHSPMYPAPFYEAGEVSVLNSLHELQRRCTECKARIIQEWRRVRS
jgi:hypothetical protein